ncbi:hypothetical protein [Nocardia beijingensis]
MTDYLHDERAVDRWLVTRHQSFVSGLAERLDLEAGLQEVMLSERHASLTKQLGDQLDLEAGLAAILPPDLESMLSTSDAADDEDAGSLEWASRELAAMPLRVRLALRAQLAPKLDYTARQAMSLASGEPGTRLDVLREEFKATFRDTTYQRQDWERGAISAYVAEVAKEFVLKPDSEGLIKNPDPDMPTLRKMFELQILTQIHNPTDREQLMRLVPYLKADEDSATECNIRFDLSDVFGPPPEAIRWIGAVGRVVETMLDELGQEGPMFAESLVDLASHLTYLGQILNDFIGADLRAVDLAGVPLEGLRWSEETTQWPDGWTEQIRLDSVELGDGLYEVHYGTSAHRDTHV